MSKFNRNRKEIEFELYFLIIVLILIKKLLNYYEQISKFNKNCI